MEAALGADLPHFSWSLRALEDTASVHPGVTVRLTEITAVAYIAGRGL